jgi:acyl transferase domain-containing protein
VDAVAQLAAIAGRRAKELDTLQAFHSPLMEPILGDLRAVATALCTSQPNLPMASNVTGDFLSGDIPPDYWVSHVRQPVLFFPGIRRILDAGCEAIIEIGPHPTLTQALAETLDARKTQCIPTLMRDRQDVSHVLETLASLYVIGAPLNLDHLFWRPGHRRVSVSLYPFRRDRHWIHGGEPAVTVPPNKNEIHPLLGKLLTAGPNRAVFEAGVSANSPWVDHRVLGSTVFPGAAYLEMAARGFAAAAGHDWLPVVMRDVTFERPLLLTYGATKRVSITLEMLPQGRTREAEFVIASLADGGTDICCRGRIARAGQDIEVFPIENAQGRMSSQLRIGQFYGDLRKKGLEYGADFSNVRELWLGDPDSGEALGHIIATASDTGEDPHPFQSAVLLDTCMQVFDAGLRTFIPAGYPGAFVPVSIQAVTLRRPLPVQCWSLVAVRVNRDGRAASARIQIMSHSGEVLAKMDGLELRQKSELAGSAGEPVARADGASHNINGAPESRGQLVARLRGSPHEKRIAALATWLVAEIRDVLGQAAEEIDFDSIDPSCALLEIGLDSLAVTELQRRIQEKLEFRFQPMQGLDYQSIESLAEYLLNDVLKIDKPAQIVSKTAAAQPGSRGFNGH